MSDEYFDSLGLIICGLNPQSMHTEVQIYDTKTCKWNSISAETLFIDRPYMFIGLRIFTFDRV